MNLSAQQKKGFITMSQFCCSSGFCVLKLGHNICLIHKLTALSGMYGDNKACSCKDGLNLFAHSQNSSQAAIVNTIYGMSAVSHGWES